MTADARAAERFPFDALPSLTKEDVADARRLRTVVRGLLRTDAIARSLSEIVGEDVAVEVRRTQRSDATSLPGSAVAVAVATVDGGSLRESVLVEVEAGLAATLVTRGLRQRAPRIGDPSQAPGAAFSGAFAALLHAVLRHASVGVPLRVLAAGPARALGRDHAVATRRSTTAAITVTIGDQAFDARVILPLDALPRRSSEAFHASELRRVGEVPISLAIVVATCAAGRADLAALRPGDAFVVPSFPLEAGPAGELRGPVALVPPRGEQGLRGVLAEECKLVIRTDRVEAHSWDPPLPSEPTAENPMPGEPTATLEVLEDAAVVVRIELGVVEMTAREWADLADGDVVLLGRRLGDPAVLRVGGVEVARGELVQVDGEYGVRILRRGDR